MVSAATGPAEIRYVTITDGTGQHDYMSSGKIYNGNTFTISADCYNNNNIGIVSHDFLLKIYQDGNLIYTSSYETLYRTTPIINTEYPYDLIINITASGSSTSTFSIQLTDSSGVVYDTKTATEQIVSLYTNWNPSTPNVVAGNTVPTSWSITVQNGGNDMMHNAMLAVTDSGGLQLSSYSASLGYIIAGGALSRLVYR